MTLTNYPNVIQGSDEWFDQRRGIVTASVVSGLIRVGRRTAIDFDCPDCGAVALAPCQSKRNQAPIKTLHPERAEVARNDRTVIIEPASNESSRGLTMLLAAERITDYTEPTYVSDDMWKGHEDEPLAREAYSEHYAQVTETGLMVRDDWGFKIGCSPDGLVGDHGIIEIKVRRQKKHLKTILADAVPPENMAQCQAALLASGREWLDYVSFCGGMPLWRKRVYPQQVWFDAILSAVRAFEDNAAEIMRLYDEAVDGLPMTERNPMLTGELKLT